MKRKKTEAAPEDGEFWPIPGVDGVPYPPLVQDALDLVEKETLRRKRLACKHTDRMFITGSAGHYGETSYRRACRDCGQVVNCEHPKGAQRFKLANHDLEFWECPCGKLIAKRPEPRIRTANYGFDYARPDPPKRERRTDPTLSRQIEQGSKSMVPLMLSLDHDPGTKPGMFESAMLKALERQVHEINEETKRQTPRYQYRGPLGSSSTGFTVRNMAGDVILTRNDYEDETEWF